MTIRRIIDVSKSYVERHFLMKDYYLQPYIVDLFDKKIDRITTNTEDKSIKSILFCDFDEYSKNAYKTAKYFKDNQNALITDHKIPVSNFTYFYGLNKDNHFFINKIENIEDDLFVMPVRNLKKDITSPFTNLILEKDFKLYVTNQDGKKLVLPYKQDGRNIGKTILISNDGHTLFIYGLTNIKTEEIKMVAEWCKEHPCYPILIDNGRYLFYYINNPTKEEFLRGGFADIDHMPVFGEVS